MESLYTYKLSARLVKKLLLFSCFRKSLDLIYCKQRMPLNKHNINMEHTSKHHCRQNHLFLCLFQAQLIKATVKSWYKSDLKKQLLLVDKHEGSVSYLLSEQSQICGDSFWYKSFQCWYFSKLIMSKNSLFSKYLVFALNVKIKTKFILSIVHLFFSYQDYHFFVLILTSFSTHFRSYQDGACW